MTNNSVFSGSMTIYDFGMNNGNDTEYYLKKGLRVVGVEANPSLCQFCRDRFRQSIRDGQLTILHCALSQHDSTEPITFYIHKKHHELSQLPKPGVDKLSDYKPELVPQRKASSIVAEYGQPHYIKIDVEHFDHVVLADLLGNNIFPDFISAEFQSIDIFCLLVAGGYSSFNLVDGSTVPITYSNTEIAGPTGVAHHSFKLYSTGPFGRDILTPWRNTTSMFNVLSRQGVGWKDVHATKVIDPDELADSEDQNDGEESHLEAPRKCSLREHLIDFIPSFVRAIKSRL